MAIKSFADTSAVSLAYGFTDAANTAEVDLQELKYIPFTTEGFTMAKEAQVSQAITASRRSKGSKNTKGSASGAFTIEFGAADFCLDMLQALLMNKWKQDGGVMTIHDGDLKQYMVVEKTIRPSRGEEEKQSHEQFFGTLINDGALELGDGELITLTLNTISANAEYTEALQGADGTGGSLVLAKEAPADYEIADASNNVKNIKITNLQGEPLELTFSSATLNVENNVREQPGIGHVFAAGIGMGKVGVNMSGEVYYYDQTLLDVHMRNERIKAEMTLETRDGKFEIFLPNLIAQSPSSNAGGENQDYATSIELVAEEGVHEDVKCTIFIRYTPADEATLPGQINIDTLTINDGDKSLDISGTTFNIEDGSYLTVKASDASGNTVVFDQVAVIGDTFQHIGIPLTTLNPGRVTIEVIAEDLSGKEVKVSREEFLAVVSNVTATTDLNYDAQTLSIYGTTAAVPDGSEVAITISDSLNAQVVETTSVASDAFELTNIDVSSLADGELTVFIVVENYNSSITELVNKTPVKDVLSTVATVDPVSGLVSVVVTTQNVQDNEPVELTLTDANNQTVQASGTILGNSAAVTGIDIFGLALGDILITGEVDGLQITASVVRTSVVFGDLKNTVWTEDETFAYQLVLANEADAVLVSGVLTDTASGSITLPIVQVSGGEANSSGIDFSSLADGELTLTLTVKGETTSEVFIKGSDYSLEVTATVDDSTKTLDVTGLVGAEVGGDGDTVSLDILDSSGVMIQETAVISGGTYESLGVDIASFASGDVVVIARLEVSSTWVLEGKEEVTYTP